MLPVGQEALCEWWVGQGDRCLTKTGQVKVCNLAFA